MTGRTRSAAAPRTSAPASTRSQRRLWILLGLLVVAAAALPISRRFVKAPLSGPPVGASAATLTRYYLERIKENRGDYEAYSELGQLDLDRGFYMAAVDRLRFARQIGAPDTVTAARLGRCYARLLRAGDARAEFERALKADPGSIDAAIGLADVDAAFTSVRRGDEDMHRFFDVHPEAASHTPSLEKLTAVFSTLDDPEVALSLAARLQKAAPSDPAGFGIAGRSLLALRRYDEAAAALAVAVILSPSSADLHYLYGVALARQPGRSDDAIAQWKVATSDDPQDGAAYRALGAEYAARKDWRSAGDAFVHAFQTHPGQDLAALQQAADMADHLGEHDKAAYYRAQAYLYAGDNEDALTTYRTLAGTRDAALRRTALEGGAECLRRMNRREEYLSAVRALANAQTADDYAHLADAYGEVENYKEMTLCLRKALELNPALAPSVHFHLGNIAASTGHRDEAEKEYQEAIAGDPASLEYRRALVQVLVDRLDLGDRLQRARREAEQIVASKQATADDYRTLGTVYVAANDMQRAIQTLQHAIDLQPGLGPPYLDLGHAYQRVGRTADGEAMLDIYKHAEAQLLEQRNLVAKATAEPKNPRAQSALGDFYADAQYFSPAAGQYRNAVALDPGNLSYHEKLARAYASLGLQDEASEQQVEAQKLKPAGRT